jgi:hypothetical protein
LARRPRGHGKARPVPAITAYTPSTAVLSEHIRGRRVAACHPDLRREYERSLSEYDLADETEQRQAEPVATAWEPADAAS